MLILREVLEDIVLCDLLMLLLEVIKLYEDPVLVVLELEPPL